MKLIHTEEDEALIAAAEQGDTKGVTLLLDRAADIHAKDESALIGAAKRGHTETVALLLDRGANIHAREDEALEAAASEGHDDVVTLLLDRGADITLLTMTLLEVQLFMVSCPPPGQRCRYSYSRGLRYRMGG